jgi:hypothetical protein
MAKKPYKLWDVFIVGTGHGCYAKDYSREFVGQTRAVSAAQACNNVRFQTRDKQYPNGGYSSWELGDSEDQGYVVFKYEAVEVK